jgi:hypothetical protein
MSGKPKATEGRPLCRHCHVKVVNRPRGMCWSCYYTPGVKDLYPTTSKYGRRGPTTEAELKAAIAEQQGTMPPNERDCT